jgi:hypothetical protein
MPGTRGIALDWTAWSGLGMATRGSIPTVMAAAGIEMLAPQAGIPWVRRELTAGSFRGEVVVGGQLGVLTAQASPAGGLDPAAVDVTGSGPMIGSVTGMGVYSGLTVQTTLDPAAQPFLHDHRIDSIPVLPGVMGVAAFAALAQLAAPDLHVAGVEQMEFRAPVKFYRDEPRTLTLRAVIRRAGTGLIADCELSGSRARRGTDAPQWTTYFTGRVRLTSTPPKALRDDTPTKRAAVCVGRGDIYRVYFHGPAYQVIDEAWRSNGSVVAALAPDLLPDQLPAAGPALTWPRLVELCFQAAGLWEIGQAGRLALPAHAGLIATPGQPAPGQPLFAVVHPAGDGRFDCRVLDADGTVLIRVDGYQTTPVAWPVADDLRRPISAAIGG